MKRIIIVCLLCFFFAGCASGNDKSAVLSWDEGMSILGLKNNGLYDGTSRVVSTNGVLESEGITGVINPDGLPGYEVVGAKSGTKGYGLDLMKLLAMADKTSSEARLSADLVQMFYDSANGELDTAKYHLSEKAFASMFVMEANSTTFLDGIYEGEGIDNVVSPSIFTLREFNKKALEEYNIPNRVGNSWTLGVWKTQIDDGTPDGPFQIIGIPGPEMKSRLYGYSETDGREWDPFFFPDSFAWVNFNADSVNSKWGGNLGASDVTTLYLLEHTRGVLGAKTLAFGLPYNLSNNLETAWNKTVNQSSAGFKTDLKRASLAIIEDMKAAYTKDVAFVGVDNSSICSLGIALLLKSGWRFEKDSNFLTRYDGSAQMSRTLALFFPDSVGMKPSDYFKKNFCVDPWELIKVGGRELTEAEYCRIYGKDIGKPYDQYSLKSDGLPVLFKVNSFRSSAYINKLPDGSDPPIVTVFDAGVIGHVAGAEFVGEYVLLDMLVKAGLPDNIDGISVDPNKPENMYTSYSKASRGLSFNPSQFSDGSDYAKLFQEVLNVTGIKLNSAQYAVLFNVYKECGTYYYLGGYQLVVGKSSYSRHLGMASFHLNADKYTAAELAQKTAIKTDYLKGTLYATENGPYISGVTEDKDLKYGGRRLYDCATLVAVGRDLGGFLPTGGILANWFKDANEPRGTRIIEYGGVSFDMSLRPISGKSTIKELIEKEVEIVRNGETVKDRLLRPGDILSRGGHVFIVLGFPDREGVLSKKLMLRPHADDPIKFTKNTLLVLEAYTSKEEIGIYARDVGTNYVATRFYACD